MSLIKYDLTIVVEMDTKDITGGVYDYHASIRQWAEQVDAIPLLRCEMIISSSVDFKSIEQLSTQNMEIKNICSAGANYYALKNLGANAASGEIVLFTDSDCRPSEGFLESMLRAFESTGAACIGGRTLYDGNDLLTVINTAGSFGYLHQRDTLEELCVVSHNVAIRRSSYNKDPFGPHNGRHGGDVYLTRSYGALGPIPLPRGMIVYHENPTYKMRGLLDRHLREIFDAVRRRVRNGVWPGFYSGLRYAVQAAFKRQRMHYKKVRKYGRALGIRFWHYPMVLSVLGFYLIVDLLAVIVMFSVHGLRDRWISYQFGRDNPY